MEPAEVIGLLNRADTESVLAAGVELPVEVRGHRFHVLVKNSRSIVALSQREGGDEICLTVIGFLDNGNWLAASSCDSAKAVSLGGLGVQVGNGGDSVWEYYVSPDAQDDTAVPIFLRRIESGAVLYEVPDPTRVVRQPTQAGGDGVYNLRLLEPPPSTPDLDEPLFAGGSPTSPP